MEKFLLSGLIMLLVIGSCTIDTVGIKENSEIDEKEREEVSVVTQQIITAIISHDDSLLKSNLSKKLNLTVSSMDTLFNVLQITESPKLTFLDEFFISNDVNLNIKSISSSLVHAKYSFDFMPVGIQTYICFIAIKDKDVDWLISLVYNRERQWKLTYINVGPLIYKGRDAIQIYELSQRAFANNNLTLASFYMNVASGLLYPGGQHFHYELEKEINNYGFTLRAELEKKYEFPIVVDKVKQKPEILSSQVTIFQKQLYPQIVYKTNLKLDDSNMIKKENNELHTIIDQIFPDYKMLSDTIIYEVIDGYNYNKSNHFRIFQRGEANLGVF